MPSPILIRPRVVVVLSLLYILLGFVALTFRVEISEIFHFRFSFMLIFGIGIIFVGAGGLLFSYLRGDFAYSERRVESDDDLSSLYDSTNAIASGEMQKLASTVQILEEKVAQAQKSRLSLKELSPEERESILSTLKVQLESVLASDVVNQIEQKYSSQMANDTQVRQIRKGIETTSSRLRDEIDALTRRGNLNLVIGTLTTAAAVGLLGYLVLGATINYNSVPDLLSHFIPRISIAVFIEVFSFFFLKLYKSSLQEIKYFQNELTNVEMRGIALETALLAIDNKTTEPIVDQLIRTDRNPASITAIASDGKDATSVKPKDVANVLDKLIKLLDIGSHK